DQSNGYPPSAVGKCRLSRNEHSDGDWLVERAVAGVTSSANGPNRIAAIRVITNSRYKVARSRGRSFQRKRQNRATCCDLYVLLSLHCVADWGRHDRAAGLEFPQRFTCAVIKRNQITLPITGEDQAPCGCENSGRRCTDQVNRHLVSAVVGLPRESRQRRGS